MRAHSATRGIVGGYCSLLDAHSARRGSRGFGVRRVSTRWLVAASYPRWSLKPRMRRVIRSIATCMPASARQRSSASLNDTPRERDTHSSRNKNEESRWLAAAAVVRRRRGGRRRWWFDLRESRYTTQRGAAHDVSRENAAHTHERMTSSQPSPLLAPPPPNFNTAATPPGKTRASRQHHHR